MATGKATQTLEHQAQPTKVASLPVGPNRRITKIRNGAANESAVMNRVTRATTPNPNTTNSH